MGQPSSIMIREFHIYTMEFSILSGNKKRTFNNKKCTPNDVHKKGRAHPLEQVSAMDYRRP